MKKNILAFLVLLSVSGASCANGLTNGAKQAILIELETGRVLLEKNADDKMHPSSLTKIMGIMPVLERLKAGRVSMTDTLPVSVRAWKQEGSRMFLEPNASVSIGDLLRGVIVQSGNDAATVLAEGLAGTESQFAQEMTDFAHNLGAKNTNFLNASGLPEDNHFSTARDIATISAALVNRYPDYYPIFSEKNFTYNKIKQGNRNPLLYKKGVLVDGIKTGSGSDGGYGIAASAEQNGMRLVLVVNGTENVNDRSRISDNILRWGFREYKKYKLFSAGDVLEEINVWLGNEAKIALVVPDNITLVLSYNERKNIKARVKCKQPISAPIAAGQALGQLLIEIPGQAPLSYPLIASKAVGEVGVFGRVMSALHYVIWGTG